MINSRKINLSVSVIVPTYNEQENVEKLVFRLDKALSKAGIIYELIFIDDHSPDQTRLVLKKIAKKIPISIFLKKGQKGKAFSLIEGFSYAKYDNLCMIDADLQYPPEAIPAMVKKLSPTIDIVNANRVKQDTSFLRKLTHNLFMNIFGKFLHNLDFDVQSGLKVFKKVVIQQVTLNPSPWTFDMEFFIKAKKAGFTVGVVNIKFSERLAGSSKLNVLKASYEIGISALKLKIENYHFVNLNPKSA